MPGMPTLPGPSTPWEENAAIIPDGRQPRDSPPTHPAASPASLYLTHPGAGNAGVWEKSLCYLCEGECDAATHNHKLIRRDENIMKLMRSFHFYFEPSVSCDCLQLSEDFFFSLPKLNLIRSSGRFIFFCGKYEMELVRFHCWRLLWSGIAFVLDCCLILVGPADPCQTEWNCSGGVVITGSPPLT